MEVEVDATQLNEKSSWLREGPGDPISSASHPEYGAPSVQESVTVLLPARSNVSLVGPGLVAPSLRAMS
ncbi:MAG TPA: hypothetical protein VGV86_10265 [Acidimicrobiales bacterium]|nr:hypothetical protein [Acidimicrobiales bacterium]